jgi:V8-like Glu-specific endopeptidase
MFSARFTTLFVFSIGVFAGVAFGQSEPEGFLTDAEVRRHAVYPTALLDMIGERLASPATPTAIPGLVQYLPPSAGARASSFADALAEDAGYRTGQMIESLTSFGFDPQRIIDGDWTEVENTKAAPYKAVCHIEMTWFDGSQTSGTAFFVGPRVLITNAHNLSKSDKPSRIPMGVEVNPGRDGNRRPFGSATAIRYAVPWEWSYGGHENDENYDIGWIILEDRTLYKRMGYHFGYQTTTDSHLRSWNLNSAGYPNPYHSNFRQFKDHEAKDQVVFPASFRHYHDGLQGSSGSPMYAVRNGNRFAVGVTCAESTGEKKFNIATRMTKRFFDYTRQLNAMYR